MTAGSADPAGSVDLQAAVAAALVWLKRDPVTGERQVPAKKGLVIPEDVAQLIARHADVTRLIDGASLCPVWCSECGRWRFGSTGSKCDLTIGCEGLLERPDLTGQQARKSAA